MTDCPCCARLASVTEDHACALACGDDLIIVSRSMVKLAAITTDLRHRLTSTSSASADYRREAAAGRVVDVRDPVAVARRMTP